MRRYAMSEHGQAPMLIVVLALGISACAEPARENDSGPNAPTGIRFLAAGEAGGFERALAPRSFSFPEDHGSHLGFRTEWWYFTGNLFTAARRHFGFELTVFRLALQPFATERASAWGTNQIWLGHFALTDTGEGRFFAAERMSRGALDLAGARTSPLRVWVEDWFIEGDFTGPTASLLLRAQTAEAGIDLELRGLERIVLQGEQGLDQKGVERGNASYYYSAPRLAATGNVSVGGFSHATSGLAWMDREWGTSALSPGVAGWDWFALQLDDGRDLMFYRLRREDGTATEFSGGSLTDGSGMARRLTAADVELEITERWRSPASDVTYPVAWLMRIPSEDLQLRIRPRLVDQEVRLSVRYWEGAVEVSGRDGLSGVGYLELAGY